MRHNGIRHVKSALYHPSTNDLAECAVKRAWRRARQDHLRPESTISFSNIERPHTPPMEFLQQSSSWANSYVHIYHFFILTLLSKTGFLTGNIQSQKDHHNSHINRRHFTIGSIVFVRDFPTGNKWLPGTVTQSKGPLSFLIKLDDGHVIRHHIDHIQACPPSAIIQFQLILHVTVGQMIATFPHNSNPLEHPPAPSHSGLRQSSCTRKPPDHFH